MLTAWKHAPPSVTIQDIIAKFSEFHPPYILGQHYFITNPITGSGLSPKWDFTSASKAGDPTAFVVGAKTGDVPAPTAPQTNVDWLSLSNAQGALAQQIFRLQTHGGQPPSSVSPLRAVVESSPLTSHSARQARRPTFRSSIRRRTVSTAPLLVLSGRKLIIRRVPRWLFLG